MNYKSVFALASLSLAAITLGSCLGSSDNSTSYADIAAVTSFSIDTVMLDSVDQEKTFTIDQINKKIFNIDSLSYGSEDSIKNILMSVSTTGYLGHNDLLISLSDSVDLSETMTTPYVLQVVSPTNNKHLIAYDVEVRVHQQKTDSLHWNLITSDFSNAKLTAPLQAAWLNGTMHVYDTAGNYFTTEDGKVWNERTATWPTTPNYISIRSFANTLWAVGTDGSLMTSVDGLTWVKQTTSNTLINLITVLDNKMLALIENNSGQTVWGTIESDYTITLGDVVDGKFPLTHLNGFEYYTANDDARALCIGATSSEDNNTDAWFTANGLHWSALHSSLTSAQLPNVGSRPYIFKQGDQFYTLPTDLAAIYESPESLTWQQATDLVLVPTEMAHTAGAAMAIDAEQRIWIIAPASGNSPEQVWNGRVNKLGFVNQ